MLRDAGALRTDGFGSYTIVITIVNTHMGLGLIYPTTHPPHTLRDAGALRADGFGSSIVTTIVTCLHIA